MTGAEIYNRVIELNEVIETGENTIKHLHHDSFAHVLVMMGLITAKKELHLIMESKYKAIK